MSITIYHNPNCGTSRNVLNLIREAGNEPHVIEYLKNPPTRKELADIIRRMGAGARSVLRSKGELYEELGLADAKWTDDELIDFMIANPVLINRPIVVTPKGARLCRPAESVLELLPLKAENTTRASWGWTVGQGLLFIWAL